MGQDKAGNKIKRGKRRRWLTKLFRRTHEKSSSTEPSTDRRTSVDNATPPSVVPAQTEPILDPSPEQSKQVSSQVGLWERAADSLDAEDRKKLESLVTLNQEVSHDQGQDFLTETIESVLSRAKKLKVEAKEATWRPIIDRIIERALIFKSLGDAAVKFDTSGYAALGWSVVSLGLTFAANAGRAREFALSSSKVITRYMAKCSEYERVFRGSDAGDEFDCQLTSVYKAVLLYVIALGDYLSQSGPKRLAHGMYKPEEHSINTRKKAIDAADAEVSGWLVTILQKRTENYFVQLRKMIENQNLPEIPQPLQECLKSLSFPEMGHRLHDIDRAANGTCKWLLGHETYRDWADSDRGLLCIRGKPGSGKSTLLRYALDDAIVASKIRDRSLLQNSEGLLESNEIPEAQTELGALVLSFFFHDRGAELQKTTLGLFRSLIHQLLSHVPEAIPDDLLTTFQDRKENMGEPEQHWTWHWRQLQEFFQLSLSKVLKSRPVWLFVDALDEYGKENANYLIKAFNRWFQECPSRAKFHICLTCRHYPALALPDDRFDICLENENKKDISTYVQAQLSSLPSDENLSTIQTVITDRASGVFMWARLTVERVLDLQGDGENWTMIKEEIDKSPRELEDIYRGLVETVRDKQNSFKLIKWICFAMKPLTLDELRWAMVVEPDFSYDSASLEHYETTKDFSSDCNMMEKRLKTLSYGLAEAVPTLVPGVTRVQFIHQSVKDFFLKEGLSILHRSQDSASTGTNEADLEGIAHYQLARTCIRYISAQEIMQSKLTGLELRAKFPLLHYASFWWIAHEQKSEKTVSQADLLDYFGWPSEAVLQRWTKIVNSLRFYHSGSDRSPTRAFTMLHLASQYRFPTRGFTMLHLASQFRLMGPLLHILQRRRLLEIDATDGNRRTPLYLATVQGHGAVVRTLLENGAGVGAHWGDALEAAASRGKREIVRILLQYGTEEMNSRSMYLDTALGEAVKGGSKNEGIRRMLLEDGAKLNPEARKFDRWNDLQKTLVTNR